MFERFTDRARRSVVLAQENARMLAHDYIGTEHLLLGLIQEGEGVAAAAVKECGVEYGPAYAKVEEIIGQGEQPPSGHIPFTPRAKKVISLALREALELGHPYIGTEHLLLAMEREGDGVGCKVLKDLGILHVVRSTVKRKMRAYAKAEPKAPPVVGEQPEPGEVLTRTEMEALVMTGDLWGKLCQIVGDAGTRERDLDELMFHIHAIQRAIGSQAAARAMPTTFRGLGLSLHSAGQDRAEG